MDPITTAIVAGLAAKLGKVAGDAVIDGYEGLKSLIKRKFGPTSKLAKAVDELEERPESNGRKMTLSEEVVAAKVDQDPELLQAAQKLLEQLKAQPAGEQYVQQAIGNYNAQAQGTGAQARVQINQPKEQV